MSKALTRFGLLLSAGGKAPSLASRTTSTGRGHTRKYSNSRRLHREAPSVGRSAGLSWPAMARPSDMEVSQPRTPPVSRKALEAAALAQPAAWLPPDWHPSNLSASLRERLRAGVAQVGHHGRLRKVLERRERGEPLIIAALGNSVTADFGGVVGKMQDRFHLGYIGTPRRCKAKCLEYGWLLPIFRYMTEHEGQTPRANGTGTSAVVNCGQAARYLSQYTDCMHSAMPENADLIIVDGVNGMHPIDGNLFRPTEKLIRQLLGLPQQPAVIVLHWFDWCACTTCKMGRGIDRHRSRSCYANLGLNESWEIGKRREESGWGVLARHYDLPVLSNRLALHPMSEGYASAAEATDEKMSNLLRVDRFTWDGLHPMPCNKKWANCPYSQLVASLINVFLSDVRSGHFGSRVAQQQSPLPVQCKSVRGSLANDRGTVDRCFAWGADRRAPPQIASNNGWRLTSMDTATSFDPPAHCQSVRGRREKAAAASIAPSSTSLPPPPPPAPCPHDKPGLTAFAPGSEVVFDLPLTASNRTGSFAARNATLFLVFLSSYEGMGTASVSCDRGCGCDEATIDAHTSGSFVSVWESRKMRAVLHGNSGSCAVRVLLRNATRSRGTKFKVSGLTMRWPNPLGTSGESVDSASCHNSTT